MTLKTERVMKEHYKRLDAMQLADKEEYMTVVDEHRNYYIIKKQAYIKRIEQERNYEH